MRTKLIADIGLSVEIVRCLRIHKNMAKNTDNVLQAYYMQTMIIASAVTTTVGGISVDNCNESAQIYHWHEAV